MLEIGTLRDNESSNHTYFLRINFNIMSSFSFLSASHCFASQSVNEPCVNVIVMGSVSFYVLYIKGVLQTFY